MIGGDPVDWPEKALTQPVPVAIGATVVQSSLYDVPGGYRAVLFDRFSGVKPVVRRTWNDITIGSS
jgi:hypothetical protein